MIELQVDAAATATAKAIPCDRSAIHHVLHWDTRLVTCLNWSGDCYWTLLLLVSNRWLVILRLRMLVRKLTAPQPPCWWACHLFDERQFGIKFKRGELNDVER
mgnify:CR=1 FL=1